MTSCAETLAFVQMAAARLGPKIASDLPYLMQAKRHSDGGNYGEKTKILRKLIAIRKRRADDLAEEEAILEMYRSALGMV